MERTITQSGALYFVQHKWELPDTPRQPQIGLSRTASGKAPSPNLMTKFRRGIHKRLKKRTSQFRTTLRIILGLSVSVLVACSKQSSGTADQIPIYPVKVGEKTDLYEVIGPNDVKFADGVKIKFVPEPGGQNNGFVFMRPNGEIGGYMRCECVGATTSTCRTTNDNPNHPECAGGCTDSEGNLHPCGLTGPLPGPPRDPTMLRFIAAKSK